MMSTPDVKAKLTQVRLDTWTSTPAEFAKFVKLETEKWARVIRDAKISADQR